MARSAFYNASRPGNPLSSFSGSQSGLITVILTETLDFGCEHRYRFLWRIMMSTHHKYRIWFFSMQKRERAYEEGKKE